MTTRAKRRRRTHVAAVGSFEQWVLRLWTLTPVISTHVRVTWFVYWFYLFGTLGNSLIDGAPMAIGFPWKSGPFGPR